MATLAIAAGAAVALGALFLLWPDSAPSQGAADPTPSATTSTPSATPTEASATVETTRNVTVDGTTVTIEEVSDLTQGAKATAEPAQDTPLGLRLLDASVITPDGRKSAFDAPITLTASGSLTVRSRYRLTSCPDVLPAVWPSPAAFPGTTRSYLRLDAPLHTASALCPRAVSKAKRLPQLTGVVVDGDVPAVRLIWQGSGALTIRAIGSASTVAAVATDPRCDGSCIAAIDSGGSELVPFQPVDPCPPATTDDSLTLVVGASGQTGAIVTVRVPGLHRAVCG